MGAGSAGIVPGRGGGHAARIPDPRSRVRDDAEAHPGGSRRQEHVGTVPMIPALDHVVVLTGDIEGATAAYETLFARSPAWKNVSDGAARVLFTLDNTSLELMAP